VNVAPNWSYLRKPMMWPIFFVAHCTFCGGATTSDFLGPPEMVGHCAQADMYIKTTEREVELARDSTLSRGTR
jgi:hypothetical protein